MLAPKVPVRFVDCRVLLVGYPFARHNCPASQGIKRKSPPHPREIPTLH